MNKNSRGILLACAASLLLSTASFADPTQAPQAKPVKCHGVNSCRGKGQCGGKGTHACAAQNACKGLGWLYLSADDCKLKGGTPEEGS